MGVEHDDPGQRFKTYALGGHVAQDPSPYGSIQFVREADLATGSPGCADIGLTDRIQPGDKVEETYWWSGTTAVNRAPPPAGPLRIDGWAAFYWRGEDEPDAITDHAIEPSLDAWVTNGTPGRLSPAQAVDAALTDPAFTAYLATQNLASGRAEVAWYDLERDRWEIGVMPWYETDPPRIHGVLVDGTTGAILGELDRPWDRDADPFP
jgi:hypothetical protein